MAHEELLAKYPGIWESAILAVPPDKRSKEFMDLIECCEDPPTVREVNALVLAWYAMPEHGAGGSLHIVLDDHNWERDSIEFCRRYAAERGDVAGVCFAELLLTCSDEQLHECLARSYICADFCSRCNLQGEPGLVGGES